MAPWLKVLATKTDNLGVRFLEPTWCKARTDSYKLSSDLHERIFETKYINPHPPPKKIPKDAVTTSVLLRTGAFIPLHTLLTSRQSGPQLEQRGSCGHLGSVHRGLGGWRGRLQHGSGASHTHLR